MNHKERWFQWMIVIILVLCISSAAATSVEKEELYNATILQLESWLETQDKSVDELQQIVAAFDSLGNSKMSKGFLDYTNVLLKAVKEEFDFEYNFLLDTLEQNEKFQNYIENDINSLSIDTVPEMISYVRGREAEYNGNIELATKLYKEALNYYDANDRYKSITINNYAAKYEKAKELANSNDLVGAYLLFAEIQGFSDSNQRMEYIAKVLGYNPAEDTPAGKTDIPDSPMPLNIISIEPSGSGKAEIKWSGGVEPINVSVCRRFNSKQNEGVSQYYIQEGWERKPQNGSGVVGGFVPGKSYWIILSDASGRKIWRKYTGAKNTTENKQMIVSRGMGFKKRTSRGLIGTSVTTKSLESDCRDNSTSEQLLIEAKFQVNGVPKETTFDFLWTLELPNGDLVYGGHKNVVCKNGRQSILIDFPWKGIYKTYDGIPEGEYNYYLCVDNHTYVKHRFWLHPKNNTRVNNTPQSTNDPQATSQPDYDPENS